MTPGSVADADVPGNGKSGQALMEAMLKDFKIVSPAQAVARCPVHYDTEPSLAITVKPKFPGGPPAAMFYCQACGANGTAVAEALGVRPGRLFYGGFPGFTREQTPPPPPLPSGERLKEWRQALKGHVAEELCDWRGIPIRTFRYYHVGWDEKRAQYTIPIYAKGKLVNVKRCTLRYEGQDPGEKLKNWPDVKGRWLYPNVPRDGWLLLCEGEWDALMGRAHRLPTVTTTGGAHGWPAGVREACKGRRVYVALDGDQAGLSATQRLMSVLTGDVRTVALPTGLDLSDYLQRYGRNQLLRLIKESSPLGEEAGVRA